MNVATQCGNEIMILGSLPIKFPKTIRYLKFSIMKDLKANYLAKDTSPDTPIFEKEFPIEEGTLTERISSSQIDIRFESEHIKNHNTISFEIEEHEKVIREGKLIIIDTLEDLTPLIKIGMQPYCELDWDQ